MSNALSDVLSHVLKTYRDKRGFNAEEYVEEKAYKLNEYLLENNIDTCVVYLDGRANTAVVYSILKMMEFQEDTNIKKVIPVFLPFSKVKGLNMEDDIIARNEELVRSHGGEIYSIDLSKEFLRLNKRLGSYFLEDSREDYLSLLFKGLINKYASLITGNGLVIGSVSLDESLFLGLFDKDFNNLVDVQLLSDLHNNEINDLCDYLELSSDYKESFFLVDDLKIDYDFLEVYIGYLSYNDAQRKIVMDILRKYPESLKFFIDNEVYLIDIGNRNSLSYNGYSSSVHMDIINLGVESKWKYFNFGGRNL